MQFLKAIILFAAAVVAIPPSAFPQEGATDLSKALLPVDGVGEGTAAVENFKRETYKWIRRQISPTYAEAYKRETYKWIRNAEMEA